VTEIFITAVAATILQRIPQVVGVPLSVWYQWDVLDALDYSVHFMFKFL
jgi:hypothetical protein